jgi:hypothetical protein
MLDVDLVKKSSLIDGEDILAGRYGLALPLCIITYILRN